MLKFTEISEWVFKCIDNFFQGTSGRKEVGNDMNPQVSNILNTNYIEWELNQDIVDLAIIDIQSSFSWIIPRFIKEFVSRLQKLGLLYLYTDVADEEIPGEWFKSLETAPNMVEKAKIKVIQYPQVIKDTMDSKCLFINDWLKLSYKKLRLFMSLELLRKPYHLLGNFAPYKYEDAEAETSNLIREFNWIKLNPAFAFHKRI